MFPQSRVVGVCGVSHQDSKDKDWRIKKDLQKHRSKGSLNIIRLITPPTKEINTLMQNREESGP